LGIDASDYGLLLSNRPDLDPGQVIVDQRKTTGLSHRSAKTGYEYQSTTRLPITTLEMDADAYSISFFCWLLFQKGSTQVTNGVEVYTFNPPTTTEGPACEFWASVYRNTLIASKCYQIDGCVVSAITLSSAQGETVKLSVDVVGREFLSNKAVATYAFSEKTPLLHQNAATTLGATPGSAGTAVDLESWSVTVSNNLITKHYDNQLPAKHLLGDITASGTFRFPYGTDVVGNNVPIANFLASTPMELIIGFTSDSDQSADADGDIALTTTTRYTGGTIATDDEHMHDLPFEAALASTGTKPIEIVSVTGYDLGIPA